MPVVLKRFNQAPFIWAYKARYPNAVSLNEDGVCAGLCLEYFRNQKKAVDDDQRDFKHFKFVKAINEIEKNTDNKSSQHLNLATRIQLYQTISQHHTDFKKGETTNIAFTDEDFKDNNYINLSCM